MDNYLKVSFDFDDTIANTCLAVLTSMRRDKEYKYPKIKDLRFDKLITGYNGNLVEMPPEEFKKDILNPCIYRKNGNWSHLFPLPGALYSLVVISKTITYPDITLIVSKRKRALDISDWLIAWFKWYSLTNYFPTFGIYTGNSDKKKNTLISSRLMPDFHVDDNMVVIKHLMKNGHTYPIIFDRPWNKKLDSEEHPEKAFKRIVPIRAVGWINLEHILFYLKNKRKKWETLHKIMRERQLTSWLELRKSGKI